jgi:hypothetical protein
MKTKPQQEDEWKVEPLPTATAQRIADTNAADLAELLAQAYRTIRALEAELGRPAA